MNKKDSNQEKTPVVQVYCTKREKKAIQVAARREGRSVSNFALRVLLKAAGRSATAA